MNTITIATFNTEAAADKVRQRLNDQGIQAKVNNQRLLQRIWFLAKPYAAYHLEVPDTDLARADAALGALQDEEHALSEAIRCPKCASLKLEYPQMTRKFVLPTLIAHGLVFLGFMQHKFYCTECHHMWAKPTKVGARPLKVAHT